MTPYQLKERIVQRLSGITDCADREAYMIIEHVLGIDKLAVITSEDEIAPRKAADADEIVARRLRREPLQYILERAYFRDLELFVSAGVLVPRRETELLVDWVVDEVNAMYRRLGRSVRVLDVGTGSGAISAAVASECMGKVGVVAVDISEEALRIAQRNLSEYENVELLQSDLFENVEGTFDIICSNPPYIGEDERCRLAPELAYEPELALFAGDGLEVYRKLIPRIPEHISEGGSFILEIGAEQFDSVNDIVISALGRTDAQALLDYSDRRRFICLKNLK